MSTLSNITIFDFDDTPFFNWMNTHPNGFVLNTERRQNSSYAVVHQSNCFHISGYTSAYTTNPFTTQDYIKICADSVEALEIWLQQNRSNANKPPKYCKTCAPLTGKTKFTGYWTFFCNPAKWEIDRFLESNIEDDIYQVTKWQKDLFQPGQMGIIRVGGDHRTKKQHGGNPKLEPGIYAFVEVRSRHKNRTELPDSYWLDYSKEDEKKPIVDIHFLKNLLNDPILIADLKNDPAIDDPYLIRGFQATTMPLTRQSFQRILELSGNADQIPSIALSFQWGKSITLKNGSLRKSYTSFAIPTQLVKRFNIEDGMTYPVTLTIPKENYETSFDTKITSGGEIHLSANIVHDVKHIAKTNPATVIQFELKLLSTANLVEKSNFEKALQKQIVHSIKDTSMRRQKRLKARTQKKPRQTNTLSTTFIRDPDVVAEVLFRAQGTCEECRHPAPFLRKLDRTPYLEVHHIIPLANNGDDTVENAIALCPNCHRKAHFG